MDQMAISSKLSATDFCSADASWPAVADRLGRLPRTSLAYHSPRLATRWQLASVIVIAWVVSSSDRPAVQ